jgi:uncharacterized membrane protein
VCVYVDEGFVVQRLFSLPDLILYGLVRKIVARSSWFDFCVCLGLVLTVPHRTANSPVWYSVTMQIVLLFFPGTWLPKYD